MYSSSIMTSYQPNPSNSQKLNAQRQHSAATPVSPSRRATAKRPCFSKRLLLSLATRIDLTPSPSPSAGSSFGSKGQPDASSRSSYSSSATNAVSEPASSSETQQTNETVAAPYEECFWDWRFKSRICYCKAGESGPPVLLVHGFGVGGYHYERNIAGLAQNHRVWAIDLLGQGQSWPSLDFGDSDNEHEDKLYYSIDTWRQQLQCFIEEHIREPVYIVGNSLGGFLAVQLAAESPDLCKGLVLLNATPFWAFASRSVGLLKQFRMDGAVPVATPVKRMIEQLWWDNLRSPQTVRNLIQLVYSHKAAADDKLIQRIIDATLQPPALDAFVSIVLSPKSQLGFDQALDRIQAPICMAYGRDDPWVVPLWGQRLKRQKPDALYLELSPAGHCPHHEAPQAVNWAIDQWVHSNESSTQFPLPVGQQKEIIESDGRTVVISHLAGSPRNVFEHVDYLMWQLLKVFRGPATQHNESQSPAGSG